MGGTWYPQQGYTPPPLKRFEEIPVAVRERLHAHLLDRFGKRYLARLTYVGGQISDQEELPIPPEDGGGTQRIFKYSIWYALSIPPGLGITKYESGIELDRDGNVVREIDLPPTRRFPEKEHLIALEKAYGVAAQLGFVPTETSASIGYDDNALSIVFELEQTLEDRDTYEIGRKAVVDAHSGNALRVEKTATNKELCYLDRPPLCVSIDDKGEVRFGR